jgi:anti-sigma regulatory factor (Ser/Thr protein kinase)
LLRCKILLMLALVGCCLRLAGQNNPVPRGAGELLHDAGTYENTQPGKSMELAAEALELAIKGKDQQQIAGCYLLLGRLHLTNGNKERAAELLEKASQGYGTLQNAASKAEADRLLALALERSGKLDKAAEVQKTYMNSSAISKKEKIRASGKNAEYMYRKGLKSEAIKELEQNLPEVQRDTVVKLELMNQLQGIYGQTGDTLGTIRMAQENIEFLAVNKSADAASFTWKFGEALLSNGSVSTSLNINEKLLTGALNNENYLVARQAYMNLGFTYARSNDYPRAMRMFTAGYQTAVQHQDALGEQEALLRIAETEEHTGNYPAALNAYRRYTMLKDSFRHLDVLAEVRKLGLNEQFARQEQRIKTLETDQIKRDWELQKQKQAIIILGAAVLLFLLLLFLLFRALKAKQQANLSNRLQSLRNQMNPHFIFNSLNSVNHYISLHQEREANRYLSSFSTLMRSVLSNSGKDFISLREELEMLRIYTDLEQARFADKFDIRWDMDEALPLDELQVPPLLLQPYVENAVWHGLRYRENRGLLSIKVFIQDNQLCCLIIDDGIGRKRSRELKTENQKRSTGTGLKNTEERIVILNKLYKTGVRVMIDDLNEEGGTLVRILIPLKKVEPI